MLDRLDASTPNFGPQQMKLRGELAHMGTSDGMGVEGGGTSSEKQDNGAFHSGDRLPGNYYFVNRKSKKSSTQPLVRAPRQSAWVTKIIAQSI
jgi:hypothetical protein